MPAGVVDRHKYWIALHQRLARAANRIGDADHAGILTAVCARIPIVSIAERRAEQLRRSKEDAKFWRAMEDMQTADGIAYREVAAQAGRKVERGKAGAVEAADKAASAEARIARLEKGEDIAIGLSAAMTRKEMLAALGWSESDARHAWRLGALHAIEGGEDAFLDECLRRGRRTEKAASAAVLRRRS